MFLSRNVSAESSIIPHRRLVLCKSIDLHDPEQNIDAGTRLLRELLLKYNGDVTKALAAYNAGEGAVAKYQGVPPYRETQTYVRRVMHNYAKRNEELQRFAPAIASACVEAFAAAKADGARLARTHDDPVGAAAVGG